MSDKFVEAFVDKLLLLERRAGANVHYGLMTPFMEPCRDLLGVQRAAKQIAAFIGMSDFTFIIAIAKQKENVAGHIDLSEKGREVFVEVDSGLLDHPDAVAATLCHEVCHKWLQINGIRSPLSVEIDNEILTDITSVFLGFGKLMLNGCKTEYVRHESTPDGTRTLTTTKTTGYLDRDQLAFVYRLVCAMRNIPQLQYMQGLGPEAALAVQQCDALHGHYYDVSYHGGETARVGVAALEKRMIEAQRTMAELQKLAVYTQASFCGTVKDFLSAGHGAIASHRGKSSDLMQDPGPDPAARFLAAIKGGFEIARLNDDISALSREAEGMLDNARAVGSSVHKAGSRFPRPASAMFSVLKCPKDGTQLKLPEKSGDVIVTCPKCKHRFAYNTNALEFPAEPPAPETARVGKVRDWIRRRLA